MAGNGGADSLIGGNGSDELFSGAGADDARLGPTNIDTINGFSAVDGDMIHLQDAVMAGIKNDASGFLDAAQFFLGSGATATQDRIGYDTTSHTLWYDRDGNGAAAAVQIATMDGSPTLSASVFRVI